jgi:Fe-S cluster biogenesis protein NfuA
MQTPVMKRIEKALDERVRPILQGHTGGIEVVGFEDGVLRVRFSGRCGGCPSANLTLEGMVSEELKAAVSEGKEVVLVTGVSDELLDFARGILGRTNAVRGDHADRR